MIFTEDNPIQEFVDEVKESLPIEDQEKIKVTVFT